MQIFDMTESNFLSESEEYEVFRFGMTPSRIDLMTTVKDLIFEDCYKNVGWFFDKEIKVKVIHYNQLIQSKNASCRLKDKLDIENLSKNSCILGLNPAFITLK
ncbi:MAG: hypothetical protein EAZ27_07925 [Cytophagales bacterium]|nr:MAG: hypothetical protein EAZ27_07925 [Cytophagales bacterium]